MVTIPSETLSSDRVDNLRTALLDWYDAQGRTLPWRIRPEDRAAGKSPDPYAIWLSEIMSQQTTLPHMTPYWRKFLAAFPTVSDLAKADRGLVMSMWAGLGYYARARNLHDCAMVVAERHGGIFPKTEADLLKLPGIGPYTGATIAAICFDEATNIVDGNVERVIARMFRIEDPLPKGKAALRQAAQALVREDRPGDYGQAVMDLGATICTPKTPNCEACPWQDQCAAHKAGVETDYPKKAPKKQRPTRYGAVFVLTHKDNVLLETRPDSGLLGGMLGLPGTDWTEDRPDDPLSAAPISRNWERIEGEVKHVFTHFDLRLSVYRAESETRIEGVWKDQNALGAQTVPTVFHKCLKWADFIS